MSERTLLLSGGSRQQVIAIETARRCGYRTVLCDYLPDNPGRHVADAFYPVSTTDRSAVLEVAKSENVAGVLAYASDPAAPTAAYVAETLGLPTNPLASVETLSVKSDFRSFLMREGLPCPQAVSVHASVARDEALAAVAHLQWPLVVKPTDSSGSKGVTVIDDAGQMGRALELARAQSRNGVLIVEEYLKRTFPHVVGGDVFVLDGKIRFFGLMSCLRDARCPLVPVGKQTPPGLSDAQLNNTKATLQQIVSTLGLRFGELNVEVIIGQDNTPYVLELGARAGGNMIPVQLSDASGIDLVRANVVCAMGDDPGDLQWQPRNECYATHVLHSPSDGTLRGLQLSQKAKAACYRKVLYQEAGSPVYQFDGANKALGILFFRFDTQAAMDDLMEHIDEHVVLDVES